MCQVCLAFCIVLFVREEGRVVIMVLLLLAEEPGRCQDVVEMDIEEITDVPSEIIKSGNLEEKSNVEESLTFIEDIVENISGKDQVNEDEE